MEHITAWLATKRVALWGGEGWDLSDDKELAAATVWFAKELKSFKEYMDAQQ
jgi:hypothetical protein